MNNQIKARLEWVRHYQDSRNAGLTCRRCGISRPTLRKWHKRFQDKGIAGLADESKRPKHSPNQKRTPDLEQRILNLRSRRNIGARRIQSELLWDDNIQLSLATIHKTLAVDDCTRCRVLRIYPRRNASNTLEFLDEVITELPFTIQRFQTDRGGEFFAHKVQEKFMEHGIKFRPIRPASPHLNGKVERSQKTDKIEFWATCDLADPELDMRLAEWQHYYNWRRPHGAHNGQTPMQKACALADSTPLWEEVSELYDPSKERFQERNYRADLQLRKLKGSL